jgi:hypothetical protein
MRDRFVSGHPHAPSERAALARFERLGLIREVIRKLI